MASRVAGLQEAPNVKQSRIYIKNLLAPKTVKQVRSFLGMVNYSKDMWRHRSHLLAPRTDLTSNKDGAVGKKRGPIKWEKVHQEAFNKIKQASMDDVVLSFPDFNKPIEIHTDASDVQLGSVIMQDRKPVAFYSIGNSILHSRIIPLVKEKCSP
jgi:RNase H-like domain found in reverse transcriptase